MTSSPRGAHPARPARVGLTLTILLALATLAAPSIDAHADERPDATDPIVAAVARAARPEADRVRDGDRKPAAVLEFCGVKPGIRVADLMASTGYYTEILSAALGPEGKVYAQNSPFVLELFADKPWSERLRRLTPGNVVRVDAAPEAIELPETVDVALLIRFYHDFYWMKVDRPAFLASVMKMLRPGGVFCVLDHHAEPGSRERDVKKLHRVDASMVRAEIEAAGFEFDGESELLRNQADDHNWNIFADQAARRDKTDRFLYRFRKPLGTPRQARPARPRS